MKNKKISIIIPIYNIEKYLQKCIESVINQEYRNLEIILIDDGSTDSCPLICEEFAKKDDRIRVYHKENGGLSSARNYGLDLANGDYIGFVDGDDYIDKQMYMQLFNLIEERPFFISQTGILDEDENNSYSRLKHKKENMTNIYYYKQLLNYKGDASVCTKLFNKKIIEGIRFDEKRSNEDILFMIEVIPRINGIVCTDIDGYHYVKHLNSISHVFGKSIHDMVSNAITIKTHVGNYFPELNEDAKRFEICQNLFFLFAIPIKYNRKEDKQCTISLQFIRRKIWDIMSNSSWNIKIKMEALLVSIFPKSISILLYIKSKIKKE